MSKDMYAKPEYFSLQIIRDSTTSINAENLQDPALDFAFSKSLGFRIVEPCKTYLARIIYSNDCKEPYFLSTSEILAKILVYKKNQSGRYELYDKSGTKVPSKTHSYQFRRIAFDLPCTTDADTLYAFIEGADFPIGGFFSIESSREFTNTEIAKTLQYGIKMGILIFAFFFSIVFFISMREVAYLFYALYIFSFGMYETTRAHNLNFLVDFPNLSVNYDYYSLPYVSMTMFLMMYTRFFLQTQKSYPIWDKVIWILIVGRIIIVVIASYIGDIRYYDTGIDVLMLIPCFIVGYKSFRKKYKPAGFLLAGLTIIYSAYLLNYLDSSFHLGFFKNDFLGILTIPNMAMLELFMFSIAMSYRYIALRDEKEQSVREALIAKENLNTKLELLVEERTVELNRVNLQLKEQASKIEDMNEALIKDNKELSNEVEVITKARILEPNVDYTGFSQLFPDDLACLSFLAELKWGNDYKCRKCSSQKYFLIKSTYARRCARCVYQESALSFTLLDNVKFSIQKAFYIVYIHYYNKNVNMNQLSLEMDMRVATCFRFSKRVQEVIIKFKPKRKANTDWTQVLMASID